MSVLPRDVRLPDAPVTELHTIAHVAKRVPKAVICLLSALQIHGLTTEAPHATWMREHGVETRTIEGVEVKKKARNVAASVRDRLLRIAQERGDDFQLVLLRFATERLLARLAASPHADQFVLKGATLFTVWTGEPHRATRDIDLLGFGDRTVERVRGVFADVVAVEVDEDGVELDPANVHVEPIREDQDHGAVRVVLAARIAGARIRLQVEVGFGDVITPSAGEAELPALLEFPAPRIRAYPRETVVAEKLEAIVQLGMANSRMKDFYDLAVLARRFDFDGATLARAIHLAAGRARRYLATVQRTLPIADALRQSPPFRPSR